MDIPYKKIFIYLLTFAAYAYTGFGSSILQNLKDAVLSAESVFGDVFKNVRIVFDKFQFLHEVFDAAVEEDCRFTCLEGQKPVPNKFHDPKSDGCGSFGVKLPTEYLPINQATKCCDAHDICYDTCNSNKDVCDLEFKRCLFSYCDTYQHANIVGDAVTKGCKAAAKYLYAGTTTLGCKSYLNSQKNACYCASTKNKYKKYTTGNDEL